MRCGWLWTGGGSYRTPSWAAPLSVLAILLTCGIALLAGCGAGGITAISTAGSGGGGGGGGGQKGDASIAEIRLDPGPYQSGDVRLTFEVRHPRGTPVDIRVRYSLDAGLSFPNVPTLVGGATLGLASSPEGVVHEILWDSVSDLSEPRVADLRFRITPLENGNPIAAGAGESPTFEVDNSLPPVVVFSAVSSNPSGSALQGLIQIEIDLEDAEQDPVDIELRLSVDGGNYRVLDGLVSPTQGLASGPSGAPIHYILEWNSSIDILSTASASLRARGMDGQTGQVVEYGPFEVNNTVPSVVIDGLDPPAAFDVVTVDFTLFDEGEDPLDVEVLYSTDGSTPALLATRALGRGGEGTAGLASSALGEAHTFFWDAAQDLGIGSQAGDVRVMLRAVDAATGVETFSLEAGPITYDGRLVATIGGATPLERIVPGALVRDDDGSLLFVDRGEVSLGPRIRRYDPLSGLVVDVAGGGLDPGEGVPALQAEIDPEALAIGPGGDIFFLESSFPGGARVRSVSDPSGAAPTVATYAGGGASTADGVDRLQAAIDPRGLAINPAGDLYIADEAAGPRIRRVDAISGIIASLDLRDAAGLPVVLLDLGDIEVDGQSNLYFSEPSGHRVYFYDNLAVSKRTLPIAGTGVRGSFGDGGLALGAELDTPRDLSLDSRGGLILNDSGNRRLRRVANQLIEGLVGGGLSCTSGVDATDLELVLRGLSTRGTGDLYIAHSAGSSARISVLRVGQIALEDVLGQGGPANPGGELFLEDFGRLTDLHSLSASRHYALESERRVLLLERDSGGIVHVAGSGGLAASGDGGPAAAAGMNPVALAVGPGGDLFLADQLNDRIRRIDILSGMIESLVLSFDPTTFPPPLNALNRPGGVAVDANGFLYVADTGNHRVLRIDPGSLVVEPFAGTGIAGDGGDGGAGLFALLDLPRGVFIDAVGNAYVLDQGDLQANRMRVRRIQALTGIIDTVAGGGALAPSGVPASQADLGTIADGVATGGALLLSCFHIADRGDFDPMLIVRVDLSLDLAVIDAGVLAPTAGTSDDGVAPTALRIQSPGGVSSDGAGAVFFAEADRGIVRRYAR